MKAKILERNSVLSIIIEPENNEEIILTRMFKAQCGASTKPSLPEKDGLAEIKPFYRGFYLVPQSKEGD